MDWTAIGALILTIVGMSGGSSFVLSTKIGGVHAAVTAATHANAMRIQAVETARTVEDTARRVGEMELEVERLKLTNCPGCQTPHGGLR